MITETLVEDLLWEDGRITGVRTSRPQGDLEADVVIIAEGVNPFLTEKAGLAPRPPQPQSMALAVKEVLALPQEKIEDRFALDEGAGAAIEIIGEITAGLPGTGFIYTNRDTVSVGVGILLDSLTRRVTEAYTILERFKQQPQVKRLIQGASPHEYSAHLIPEGGYREMPRLYGDGVLVAGDAAGMVNAINTEGANLALLSGKMAAETVLTCRHSGDFSATALARYRQRLEKSLVLKDLKKYQDATSFLSSHPRLFKLYPALIASLAREFLSVDNLSKAEKERLLFKLFRSQVPTRQLLKDLYDAWRALT
jgi:electron transfer flavoprotein-quinone oxidoreductase